MPWCCSRRCRQGNVKINIQISFCTDETDENHSKQEGDSWNQHLFPYPTCLYLFVFFCFYLIACNENWWNRKSTSIPLATIQIHTLTSIFCHSRSLSKLTHSVHTCFFFRTHSSHRCANFVIVFCDNPCIQSQDIRNTSRRWFKYQSIEQYESNKQCWRNKQTLNNVYSPFLGPGWCDTSLSVSFYIFSSVHDTYI